MSPLSFIPSSFPPPERDIPKKVSQTRSKKGIPSESETPSNNPSVEESPLQLSSECLNLETYHSQMQKLPDTRQDYIAQLQRLIAQGTYSIPAEKLADKLIREL